MSGQTHIRTGSRQTIIRQGTSIIGLGSVVIRTNAGVDGADGAVGPAGPAGPQGPPGAGGGSGTGESYIQSLASTTWVVNHTMGFFPAVSTFDTTGDEIQGNVTHNSVSQVVITYNVPVSGITYLS